MAAKTLPCHLDIAFLARSRFFLFLFAGLMLFGGCSRFASERTSSAEQAVVYPAQPAPARIIALGSITGRFIPTTRPSAFRRFVTGEEDETPPGGLIRPLAVAVQNGRLLVCDAGLKTIVRVDPVHGGISPFLADETPAPVKPVALATDASGRVFVADVLGGQVMAFDADGRSIRDYRPADPTGKFQPIAVAISGTRLYAADRKARSVDIFDVASGRHLGKLAGGDAGEEFLYPAALCTDGAGRIYVVDLLKCKVQVYDSDGRFANAFGSPGDRPGHLARPRSVAVDPHGIVYVSDAATQVVQMFDPSGNVLMSFGGPGLKAGGMTLPAGLALDGSLVKDMAAHVPPSFVPEYLIFVADQLGPGRIGVYAFGQIGAGRPTSRPGER